MELPVLPEGYTARGTTMEDALAVMELVAASNVNDLGSPEVDLEEIQAVWIRPSVRLDLDEHLVFDESGRLVAWAELYHAQDAQGVVHPQWRGRGIGTHLLHWTERRAAQMSLERNVRPLVRQSAFDGDDAAHALFSSHGYAPAWNSWILQMPLRDEPATVPPPRGITIRRAADDDERAVHQVIDTSFGEWEDREPETFEDWHAYVATRASANPSPWFVAVSEDRVVAAATTMLYPPEAEGWIEEFAVAREHRRRGIGTALLTRTCAELRRAGAEKAMLSTDSRGAGRHLYESAGMSVVRSFTKFAKELRAERP
jgi:GNAT superfamily N-acetyltransferase